MEEKERRRRKGEEDYETWRAHTKNKSQIHSWSIYMHTIMYVHITADITLGTQLWSTIFMTEHCVTTVDAIVSFICMA